MKICWEKRERERQKQLRGCEIVPIHQIAKTRTIADHTWFCWSYFNLWKWNNLSRVEFRLRGWLFFHYRSRWPDLLEGLGQAVNAKHLGLGDVLNKELVLQVHVNNWVERFWFLCSLISLILEDIIRLLWGLLIVLESVGYGFWLFLINIFIQGLWMLKLF